MKKRKNVGYLVYNLYLAHQNTRWPMKKEKFLIEYVFHKASRNSLWNHLTTTTGLSEWFADDVTVKGNIYIFIWNKSPMEAELLSMSPNNKVRFRWLEDENADSYFEFKLHTDEITGAVVLEVIDFAYPQEKEEAIALWDSQIKELKRTLGI